MTGREILPPIVPRLFLRLSLPEGTLRDSILGDFSKGLWGFLGKCRIDVVKRKQYERRDHAE